MALYKYHYIELDTKRSPRISLQNIVAGETGNRLWITVTNNGETIDMSEKENDEFIYRVSLRINSDLGTRRQDSDDPNGGITFIEANTGDHGKINILLSADSFTVGKNRCCLEIYSKRSEDDDTLICSAEWSFDAAGNPTGENSGVVYPMMAYYEQLAKSWAVGGTGKREGEDEDNARYWSELAKTVALPDGCVTTEKLSTESVTEGKLSPSLALKTIKDYVTPEMFGAKGDGITDDTAAWQAAVNAGVDVKATKSLYKCGKITVQDNLVIDCNNASFICTGDMLFECKGTVTASLTGEKNYTANDADYTITNANHSSYTGYAMLKGTNLFDESRDYYYGGFVCTFRNGKIDSSYPIDVINGTDNITIDLIDPITVTLRNICGVTFASTTGRGIVIEYGYGCLIENVRTNAVSKYTFISLLKSLNCICRNLNISAELGTTGTNSYIVGIEDSSYCSVQDSYLYNKHWHCVTTGANYLCYRNSMQNCVMMSETGAAYCDHANGVGTIVRDCKISYLYIGYMGYVDNVVITSSSTSTKSCMIAINLPTDQRLVGASINNVTFLPTPGTANNQCGIKIAGASRLSNKTFYAHNIKISNTRIIGATSGQIWFSFMSSGGGSLFKVGTIELVNTQGEIYLGIGVNNSDVDITDYKLFVRDCKAENTSTKALNLLGSNTSYKFNYVDVANCRLTKFSGKYEKIVFSHVYFKNSISNVNALVKEIRGDNIDIEFHSNFFITGDSVYTCAKVALDCTKLATETNGRPCFNVSNDNVGNKYYQIWENGVLTSKQITV